MVYGRHSERMSPATIPTVSSEVIRGVAERDSSESGVAAASRRNHNSSNGSATVAVPYDVIDRLAVYIAGPHEDDSVAELAARAGAVRPDGALMVAAADGKLLAAGSVSRSDVVSELTPAGAAAAAVVRYRIASLRRRQRARRPIAA
jgi:hypothetical protein